MKKIIATVTFLIAISLSANAQDKNSPQVKNADTEEIATKSQLKAAKKDAIALSQFMGLNATQQDDFERLFQMKYRLMQNPSATIESIKEMSRIVGLKIEASFDASQFEKLKANNDLYKQLITDTTLEAKKTN